MSREDGASEPAAAIEALRAQGAQRLDPVRWRQLEALARRAITHQGATRRLLDERLARLLAACALGLQHTQARAVDPTPPPAPPSPLGQLLQDIAARTVQPRLVLPDSQPCLDAQAPVELRAVREYRSTWTRLRADRRLSQALAQVPDQAGPLNTQRLLHQALTVMRDASPAYLNRLLSQVEALAWLDQASLPSAAPQARRRHHARPGRQQ